MWRGGGAWFLGPRPGQCGPEDIGCAARLGPLAHAGKRDIFIMEVMVLPLFIQPFSASSRVSRTPRPSPFFRLSQAGGRTVPKTAGCRSRFPQYSGDFDLAVPLKPGEAVSINAGFHWSFRTRKNGGRASFYAVCPQSEAAAKLLSAFIIRRRRLSGRPILFAGFPQ